MWYTIIYYHKTYLILQEQTIHGTYFYESVPHRNDIV